MYGMAPLETNALALAYVRKAIEHIISSNCVVHLDASRKTFFYNHLVTRVQTGILIVMRSNTQIAKLARALQKSTPYGIATHTTPDVQPYLPDTFGALLTTPDILTGNHRVRNTMRQTTFRLIVFDDVGELEAQHDFRSLCAGIRDMGVAKPRLVALMHPYSTLPGRDAVPSRSAQNNAVSRLVQQLAITHVVTMYSSGIRPPFVIRQLDDTPNLPHSVLVRHTPKGAVELQCRTPHNRILTFVKRVEIGSATPFANEMLSAMLHMEHTISIKFPQFNSPIWTEAPTNCWASDIHGMYLSEGANRSNQLVRDMLYSLMCWYSALRLIVESWECADWAASLLIQLLHCDETEVIAIWPYKVAAALREALRRRPKNLQVLFRLRGVLIQNFNALVPARVVVLVDSPVMAHVVFNYITMLDILKEDAQTTLAYDVRDADPLPFVLNSKQVAANMEEFNSGDINVIVTTAKFARGMLLLFFFCVLVYERLLST